MVAAVVVDAAGVVTGRIALAVHDLVVALGDLRRCIHAGLVETPPPPPLAVVFSLSFK